MFLIFITAIPMAILSSNLFLFLVAICSFYLAYAGMRFARNRTGMANIFDWAAVFFNGFIRNRNAVFSNYLFYE